MPPLFRFNTVAITLNPTVQLPSTLSISAAHFALVLEKFCLYRTLLTIFSHKQVLTFSLVIDVYV